VRLEIAGEGKYSQLAMPRTSTLDRTFRASADGARRAIGGYRNAALCNACSVVEIKSVG
jgi:hypothetical protein